MRGTGSGGAVGRVGLELAGAADEETDGGAAGGGICAAGGGVTGRAGGATTGFDACGGTATGEPRREARPQAFPRESALQGLRDAAAQRPPSSE